MRKLFEYVRKSRFFQRTQGFTLIELMLVIAVIGILALVSVPKYNAMTDTYRLQESAETAVAQIRLAKQMAIDGRKTIYVGFTLNQAGLFNRDAGGTYVPISEGKKFEAGVEFDPAESLGLTEVTISSVPVYTFSYDPRGFVFAGGGSGGDAATIKLKNVRTNRSVMVNVQSGTGYATYSY